MKRRELTAADVEFTLECEPEHIPYVGNCSALDHNTDREQEEWIAGQLDGGNEWAWCIAKVTAKWRDFDGVDYLGGCSYLSEEDFRKGGYFDDMKDEALTDLNRNVQSVGEILDKLPVVDE